MRATKDRGYQCFKNDSEDTFFFGSKGYVDIVDNMAIAHIILDKHKLRTSDFSEREFGVQEIPISFYELPGMLKYLEVPSTTLEQKRLATFKNLISGKNNLIKLGSWNALGRVSAQ